MKAKTEAPMKVKVLVKEHLDKTGWSIAKLARKADLDYKTVSRLIENPRAEATTHTLGQLAEAFEVSVKDLVEDASDPK